MKIIGTDNLARETVADFCWLDDIKPEEKELAQRVCDRLNEGLGHSGGTYFKLVEDDYKLSRGMEDFI